MAKGANGHGARGYNKGCRCAFCRAGHATYQREYLAKNPEQVAKSREQSRKRRQANLEEARRRDRERYHNDPRRKAKVDEARRRSHFKNKYGLTVEEGFAIQAKPCEMCGAEPPSHIDHHEECGGTRGPACQRCNMGLGLFDHNPVLLRKAAEYLERHQC